MSVRVDVYSDLSCPWCYLGNRNLRAALAEHGDAGVEVVSHPYQIDGEEPAEPVPVLEFLGRKYGVEKARRMSDHVTRAGAALGVEFRNDRALAVNTLAGHRLLRQVDREFGGRVRADVEEALYAQWFVHGGVITDPAVLTAAATGAGVPAGRAAELVADDRDTAAVRARIAATRAEVPVVPTVVVDGRVRLEDYRTAGDYLAALRSATTPEHPSPTTEAR
ncbi:DsbA family oxidoreductase [Saccharothrix sp. Mg75]|uniref:DsbA family oxidoreductase n=1 Tax=Saccharothrix sp. Mg75 TaxID=3445357 RepID=UPI003EEC9EA7